MQRNGQRSVHVPGHPFPASAAAHPMATQVGSYGSSRRDMRDMRGIRERPGGAPEVTLLFLTMEARQKLGHGPHQQNQKAHHFPKDPQVGHGLVAGTMATHMLTGLGSEPTLLMHGLSETIMAPSMFYDHAESSSVSDICRAPAFTRAGVEWGSSRPRHEQAGACSAAQACGSRISTTCCQRR